jgi:hypothetical protein
MPLAIDWPHDPGENGSATWAGGPMTLAIRGAHEAGENTRLWPHESGVWQAVNLCQADLERRPEDGSELEARFVLLERRSN